MIVLSKRDTERNFTSNFLWHQLYFLREAYIGDYLVLSSVWDLFASWRLWLHSKGIQRGLRDGDSEKTAGEESKERDSNLMCSTWKEQGTSRKMIVFDSELSFWRDGGGVCHVMTVVWHGCWEWRGKLVLCSSGFISVDVCFLTSDFIL